MRESLNDKKSRMNKILSILSKEYPFAQIQLEYENPFELMVSTILSAQCTDARVNIVTEKLFKKYRKPKDYLKVPIEELEKDIYSTGYYKAKARHIRAATKVILENFKGEVPGTMDELLSLPGVGRKTANVILGHCFDTPGIVVDTHVGRIANRLGMTMSINAEKIEYDLMELIPKKHWVIFTHYLINHGRKVCTSRKAKCEQCIVSELCPSAFKIK
ncbi:MAG: endonuclease III [Ignavibacteriae bacterium]|nr:endonuclease III [Ignavibacteriota bacterium]